jgi:thiamine biosynthesis protein ThiS
VTEPIRIHLNGDPLTLARPATVAGLLRQLGLDERPVAVERNGDLVARGAQATTELADGDRIEVVTFVGGG